MTTTTTTVLQEQIRSAELHHSQTLDHELDTLQKDGKIQQSSEAVVTSDEGAAASTTRTKLRKAAVIAALFVSYHCAFLFVEKICLAKSFAILY